MSELPPADATPLRVTGTLFKDLVITFEPQDVPDGAWILRTLKRNSAIIMDEIEDASIVLIDPELPSAPDLLREAAKKIVLHYSVTPDNINNNFGYFPLPPPSNPQLQTPRPTPENRSYSSSTPSIYSQSSAGVAPPSSQPPYSPTPSHWSPDSLMLQQQALQSLPASQVAPYSSQPMQSSNAFSPFPMSQPTDMGTMSYTQQPAWSSLHSGQYGTVQPPTIDDLRRAYEFMMMWFQRPPIYQQLPPPPTPTQQNTTFHLPPLPPTQNPPSTGTQSEAPRVSDTPVATTMLRQDSTDLNNALPDFGDLSGGPSPETFAFVASSSVQSETILSLPLLDNPAGPATLPAPLHTNPKLFEHDVGKPIVFCIPIILKNRGKIAEIFRATGGRFTDDVEDADYVVLGQWEEYYFDEMWYSAQDCDKLTVTPAFVIDSYEKGRLMNPNDYPTRGPEKPRKGERKAVRSRPATGVKRRRGRGKESASFECPTTLSGETPKWLRFFKEAEHIKSLQYIGAMFKKNADLTYDALAIHLHNKMSNHTINSWKKYCLYHQIVIEDLRKRAISNAERKGFSMDLTGVTGIEATEATPPIPQQVDPQQLTPQQAIHREANLQPTAPQPDILQQIILQPTTPRQATPQPVSLQQAVALHDNQAPSPPHEKVASPEPVLVKTEPLGEDQLDFAFATEVLSGWKPDEESDAALWKRMETMRSSASSSSWEAFCEKHWSRFEHFFTNRSTQA